MHNWIFKEEKRKDVSYLSYTQTWTVNTDGGDKSNLINYSYTQRGAF